MAGGVVGVGVGNQAGFLLPKGVQPQVYLWEIYAAFKYYLQYTQVSGVAFPATSFSEQREARPIDD